MNKNADSQVLSRLRWQLFGVYTVFLMAVAGLVFSIMGAKMRSLIFDSEVDKLRPAARELAEVCADYLMSASDRELRVKFVRIMKAFPSLSYVLFVDRDGKIHSRGGGKAIDPLKQRLAKTDASQKSVNVIRAGGESYVDIAEVTPTLPPLPVHVGFAKSLTNAEARRLLQERGAAALALLAGGLLGGFLLLAWVTRPVLDLTTQAERLSLGDMSVRLNLKCRGEIGKLYLSLERLRESVMYAMRRLDNTDPTMKGQFKQKPPEEETTAKGEGR